jgi:hypothetical protein
MRWKNDVKLANKVHGVDLVLGGYYSNGLDFKI